MELYMTVFCAMLVATLHPGGVRGAENLKCYSCNSKSSPECAEGDAAKLAQHTTVCNSQAIELAKNALNSASKTIANWGTQLGFDVGKAPTVDAKMVCLKAEWTDKDSDQKSVMRSCSLAGSEDWCTSMTKSMESQKSSMVSCSQCESELCNGAPFAAPSVLPMAVALLSLLAFFRQ